MRKIILLFLLLPVKLFAQDIAGVWTGTIYNDTTKKYIPYEIAISEEKGKLSGFSHTTFIEEDGKKITVKSIKLKRKDDQLFVEDDEWVYKNFPEPAPKGVKQRSVLSLTSTDSEMVLSGPFNTNRTKEYLPITGTIRLTRKNKFHQTNIIAKLDELKLSGALSFESKKDDEDIAVSHAVTALQATKTQNIAVPISLITKDAGTNLKHDEKEEDFLSLTKITSSPIASKNVGEIKVINSSKIRRPEILPPVEKQITVTDKPKEKPAPLITPQKIKEKDIVIAPPASNTKTVVQTKEKEKQIEVAQQPVKKIIPQPEIKQKASVVISSSPVTQAPLISAEDLAKRKIETIKSVYFKSDSLTLTLYDNGEVDGDTVSILLNGKVIMPRVGLTTNAIKKTIYLTPDLGDSLQLIMYAENLGSIPPNTGLLIVQDGDDRYEIRFAGDLQKNSAIILRRKSIGH